MKILIPLDGSPGAEAALPKAMELAKQSDGAKLCLVRAVEIIDAAKTVKADLVVMASRGAEVTPGTLAEFVRQRTGIPIVLVPWSRRTVADAAFVQASA
jgi:nucleotide-binding universal stress UspA family protein